MRNVLLAIMMALMVSGCSCKRAGSCSGGACAPGAGCCAKEAPMAVAAKPEAVKPQLSEPSPTMPKEVHWFRNSAERRALAIQAYRNAKQSITELARDREVGSWGVSLDADETIIDNSPFQVDLWRNGQTFNIDLWNAWCRREEATPLAGAADFMRHVQALGGKVIVVSNRGVEVQAETETVFRRHGIPYDLMLLKTTTSDKNPRFESVRAGTAAEGFPPIELLMWVGDNIEDFPHTHQTINAGTDDAFSCFGVSCIVLPNPMYGSWERVAAR